MSRWLALACVVGCGDNKTVTVCPPSLVFLDRGGGHYEPAAHDDPATNRSALIDIPRDLPAWSSTTRDWGSVIECVRYHLGQFHAQVTDIDPGDTPHYKIVFTPRYWGELPCTTYAVPDGCGRTNRIGFVFGDTPSTATGDCRAALAAVGQLAADLSFNASSCEDVVTPPGQDCGDQALAFLDEPLPCVDSAFVRAPCRCGGIDENTYQAMTTAFASCGSDN